MKTETTTNRLMGGKDKEKLKNRNLSPILIENILELAKTNPGKLFTRLLFPGKENIDITYGKLLENSTRWANLYASRGIKQNEVVIIILQHGPELVYSFVGAMLHGAIPSIFAFPSAKIPKEVYHSTLEKLLDVSKTKYLVTYPDLAEELKGSENLSHMELILEKDYEVHSQKQESAPKHKSEDIVLLQHSSGTTGLKKGVALSNQSVMNQIKNYAQALKLTESDKIASWLPLYHDMGLIACFILPIATGTPVIMMSPFDWVTNPRMLFDTITNEKATLCWLPNFSYNFLAQRITKKDGLDISSMRAFVNCAEPVSSESHQIFLNAFKDVGANKEMLTTCYAMAENTYAITQSGITEPAREEVVDWNIFISEQKAVPANESTKTKRTLLASGTLITNNQVRIVDNNRADLGERCVGEIAIQSDSMLTEYYHRPEITKEAVVDGWYYTGDLGYLADGHLFVTGRKKDMIIVAGKNIYPQDIEDIVSGVEGILPGRVVSFGIFNEAIGTEDVVILAETKEENTSNQTALKLAIAKKVKDELECIANKIHLLPHMWLLKSSSGKISRPGNKKRYLEELRGKS